MGLRGSDIPRETAFVAPRALVCWEERRTHPRGQDGCPSSHVECASGPPASSPTGIESGGGTASSCSRARVGLEEASYDCLPSLVDLYSLGAPSTRRPQAACGRVGGGGIGNRLRGHRDEPAVRDAGVIHGRAPL